MPPKNMTLRLPEEQAAALEAVARVEEVTISDAIRTAIDESIERRRADKQFQERLQAIHDRDRAIFERLGS